MAYNQAFIDKQYLDDSYQALKNVILTSEWDRLPFIAKHLCVLQCPYDLLLTSRIPIDIAFEALKISEVQPIFEFHIIGNKSSSPYGSISWLHSSLKNSFELTIASWSMFNFPSLAHYSVPNCIFALKETIRAVELANLEKEHKGLVLRMLCDDFAFIREWNNESLLLAIISLSQYLDEDNLLELTKVLGIDCQVPCWDKIIKLQLKHNISISSHEKLACGLVALATYRSQITIQIPVKLTASITGYASVENKLSATSFLAILRNTQMPTLHSDKELGVSLGKIFGYAYQHLATSQATAILQQWLRYNVAIFNKGISFLPYYTPRKANKTVFIHNCLNSKIFEDSLKQKYARVNFAINLIENNLLDTLTISLFDDKDLHLIMENVLSMPLSKGIGILKKSLHYSDLIPAEWTSIIIEWRSAHILKHLSPDEAKYSPDLCNHILSELSSENSSISFHSNEEIYAYWLWVRTLNEETFLSLFTEAYFKETRHSELLLSIANHTQPLSLLKHAKTDNSRIAVLSSIQSAFSREQ